MNSIAWTEEEDKVLLELLQGAPRAMGGKIKKGFVPTLASCFPNRSLHSIEQRASFLTRRTVDFGKRGYQPWRDEEIAALRALYSGTRWKLNLREHFPSRDPRDVREKARMLGLARKQLRTEAKPLTDVQAAMMAGLILGDGCLNHRIGGQGQKQHINTIAFTNTDAGIVELFASMASNCIVHRYDNRKTTFKSNKPHYEASICSREAVIHTLTLIMPYLVSEKLAKAREMMACLQGIGSCQRAVG